MKYSMTLSSDPPTVCDLCGEPAYLRDRAHPFCIVCAVGNFVVLHLLIDSGKSSEEEIKQELKRVGRELLDFYSEERRP